MSYVGTAGLGAINCSLLPFGGQGLTDPACWCLTVGPTVCDAFAGSGTWAAANALNMGGPPGPAAPVVNLPPPSNVPPASGADAQAAVDAAIAANVAANQAANQAFMASIANTAAANTPASSGFLSGSNIDWGLLAVVAVGAVLGIVILQNLTRVSRYS